MSNLFYEEDKQIKPKKKYGAWSSISSVAGILFLIVSYSISETPNTGEKVIIGMFFFPAIAFMFISIVVGLIGIAKQEKGFLKYIGILIVSSLLLVILFTPIFIGIYGFREP
ncbi:hypothetical protein [Sporosarcina sp. D27]|uniref:hypothetical protein n=1 Tax=Sporosarcina sp. D27 TaxID=1382305 RepID=UPI00046FC0A7|nr:hypothetical protein [Sporosarcina sp. D27]